MSVDFVQFIRFVNVFWPLAKCHKEAKYHSNKILLSLCKKVVKEDSLGAKLIISNYFFLNAAINQKMQNKKVRVIGTLQCN